MGRALGLTDIQSALGDDWASLKTYIGEALHSEVDLLNKINGHLFSSSGKMLRPLLSLLVSKACGSSAPILSMVCAASSEIIHTATLLHDDVVDESKIRRGKITVNALFSPGASLLMGDFWLARAMKLIVNSKCDYRVLDYFSQTIQDLAEGELLQMEKAADGSTTFDDYINIIKYKTSSLFIASMCSVAVAEGVTSEIEDAIKSFATYFGIAFQMRDDILDYSLSPKDGKDTLSDISEKKITLPLLCAFERSENKGAHIREMLKGDISLQDKEYIYQFVTQNDGLNDAKSVLRSYIKKGEESLSILPNSIYKEYILSIAEILNM